MATYSTTTVTSPSVSTTGTLQRTVADTIRRLFPSNTIMALVQSGLGNGDDYSKETGLIKKRGVSTVRYECFTYTPLAITVTCSDSSSPAVGGFDVASADGLTLGMCLMNTRNRTVCKIVSISTLTIGAVTVGSTTFTLSNGDVLLLLAPAYHEASTSPYLLTKDDDNVYNLLQIVRFAVQISKSAKDSPHYGGNYWKRMNEKNVVEGLRKCDNTLIWSERASSGDTTTDGTLGNMRTTRGLNNWAGVSYDAGGALTYEGFMSDIVLAMNDTVGQDTNLICLTGKRVYAEMLKWVADKQMIMETGSIDKFGVKTKKFVTAGPEIEVMLHDSMDRGQLNKLMLFFDPADLEYNYKNGRDLHPINENQAPENDYLQNEILGEIGLSCLDGGSKVTLVTNCGNWA